MWAGQSDNDGRPLNTNENKRPAQRWLVFLKPQFSQLAWRRRMTRKAPVPSRPAATTATAMLGPVVARACFVGVRPEAATAGVEDGLAGVPVLVVVFVVTVVAGADGIGVASLMAVSVAGGAVWVVGEVVSVAGADGVSEGVGAGAETVVSVVGGMLLVDGGVLLVVVGVSGVLLGL